MAGIGDQARSPLWRAATSRAGNWDSEAMTRFATFRMIQCRAQKVGIDGEVCCHSLRATGITIYRKNGGRLEDA